MSATATKAKIYHLLNDGSSTVEMYTRVNKNQRVRDKGRRDDRPYLQITFMDENQRNRTIRLKLNCDTPYQDEQIEKHKILANEKFTNAEMDACRFRNGVLLTKNPAVIKFLDLHPQNENFKGECPDVLTKLFKEFDPVSKKKEEVGEFFKRLDAANKIKNMDLDEAQSTLIRLHGSFYKTPEDLEDCILQLVDYMDAADELGLDALLREGKTLEDEIDVLIGKLTQSGILSFTEPGMENFVVKKKNSVIIPVKEISGSLSPSERKRYLAEFMASTDGRLLLEDMRKELKALGETKDASEGKSETKVEDKAQAKASASK